MGKVIKIICMFVFAAALFAQTPTFTAATVVNGLSFVSEPIAARELVEILGRGLGPATTTSCSVPPIPTWCSGTSVLSEW